MYHFTAMDPIHARYHLSRYIQTCVTSPLLYESKRLNDLAVANMESMAELHAAVNNGKSKQFIIQKLAVYSLTAFNLESALIKLGSADAEILARIMSYLKMLVSFLK